MSIDELLTSARNAHQQLLIDTVSVWRETRGALNAATGKHAVVNVSVYDGPCRLKAAPTSTKDVAEAAVVLADHVLVLPYTAAADGLLVGDIGTVTPGNPVFGSIKVRVTGTMPGSTNTARRYTVERVDA